MSNNFDQGGIEPGETAAEEAQPKSRAEQHTETVRIARAKTAALKAQYAVIKDSPALADLLAKVKSFSDYHTSVAKAGVGYKMSPDGKTSQEVRLTGEERLREIDRSAGIDEIADYLERQLA